MTADEHGRITVTSLDVAEKFGKSHKNVLQSIESLEIPDDFRRAEFSAFLIETPMPRGRGVRTQPAYAMTRDGFALLVMGFTGKKAMEWKVRYIQAFNAMEAELKRREEARLKALEIPEEFMRAQFCVFMVEVPMPRGGVRTQPDGI